MCLEQKFFWACGCKTSHFVHSRDHLRSSGLDCQQLHVIEIRVDQIAKHKRNSRCMRNLTRSAASVAKSGEEGEEEEEDGDGEEEEVTQDWTTVKQHDDDAEKEENTGWEGSGEDAAVQW
ncbi:MAG: hypothetical protein M1818_007976 [Claussenomyces sp. TS43310]|nr:MAG: hypothetical protein M1818_007976 [Claussenomyces sp. TS43310]